MCVVFGVYQLIRKAFNALTASGASTDVCFSVGPLTDHKPTCLATVQAAFREADVGFQKVLEHESLGRADTAIFLGKIWVGAGMACQNRKARLTAGPLDGAADIPLLEELCHAFEAFSSGLAGDLVAVDARESSTNSLQKPRPNRRISDAADFPPKNHRKITEIIATQFPAIGCQSIGVGGATTRPRNR